MTQQKAKSVFAHSRVESGRVICHIYPSQLESKFLPTNPRWAGVMIIEPVLEVESFLVEPIQPQ